MTFPYRTVMFEGPRFSPALLFKAGEVGAWYDPSDLASMFQDSAGTTAAALEAPVGLMLDKSRSLTIGSELVTNGDFSGGSTGWTLGANWSVSGGAASKTSGAGNNLSQTVATIAGRSYKVTFDVSSVSGTNTLSFANATGINITSNGAFSAIITAVISNGSFTIVGGTFGVMTIDNISVREIAGNHANQATSTSFRPVAKATPSRLNFDASDDRLLSALNPTASGSIAVRILGGTASRVAIGSQGATNGRAFIGLAADGAIAAGIGADTTSTIKGSTDVRNAWTTGVVTWDGSTVNLYANGSTVYSGAQNGAVNTTIPFTIGSLNNNSTTQAFWDGGIGGAIVLNRAMTASEVTSLHSYWRSIS